MKSVEWRVKSEERVKVSSSSQLKQKPPFRAVLLTHFVTICYTALKGQLHISGQTLFSFPRSEVERRCSHAEESTSAFYMRSDSAVYFLY